MNKEKCMKNKVLIVKMGAILALATILFTACPMDSDDEPTRYTVKFSAGESTSTAPESQTVEPETSITLPGQGSMTSPTGKNFAGWMAGDKTYAAGTAFTVTGNTSFVAQWTSNPVYTVRFTVGTGTGTAPASQTVETGKSITLPDQGEMIAPADHLFDGWETGDHAYAAKASFTVTANIEFIAQWKNIIDPAKTYVEFNNMEQFPAIIYSDPSRQTEIARVPAEGKELIETDPKPQGTSFYPQFLLEFEEIPLAYNGTAVMMRVDEKKVNEANIPKLISVETGSAFVKIENESAYSMTFNKGSSELSSLGLSSTIIMPKESAAYQIEPGTVSLYKAMKNGSAPITFPVDLLQFEAEMLYTLAYDGNALTLSSTKPLMQALTMLPAPSKVAVSVVSASSVSLTWTAVENATSYKVYRASALDGEYAFLETVSDSPYTSGNLSGGTSYYYKVQAVNDERESPLSAASAILILPSVQGLTAQVEEAASISLSWSAVSGVSEYKVYRSSDPDAGYTLLETLSELTYTDENPSVGTGYTYAVQAVDTQTAGASSLATIAARILAAPQPSAQAVSESAISLSWAAVEGATTYTLYRSSSLDTDFTPIETLSELAYIDQSLSVGSAYYYKLKGANAQGDGVVSAAVPIKILPAPQQVQAQASSTEAAITLSWETVTGATSYQVYRSTTADTGFAAAGTTSSLSYTNGSLSGGTTYYYKIQALHTVESGASPLSAQVSATTLVLEDISNLTYSSVSGGTWEVQSDGSRQSPSIGSGGMTKARVSFTSNVANTSVTIQLRVNTYGDGNLYRSNYAFISTLDNAAATKESGYYSGSLISGSYSVSITIPVPTAGNHFIDIGYQQANYSYSSSYHAWFTVTNY
jgi:fibronectin type 3 domain-containing protein